jgi:hypothetical protein
VSSVRESPREMRGRLSEDDFIESISKKRGLMIIYFILISHFIITLRYIMGRICDFAARRSYADECEVGCDVTLAERWWFVVGLQSDSLFTSFLCLISSPSVLKFTARSKRRQKCSVPAAPHSVRHRILIPARSVWDCRVPCRC